MAGLLAIAAHGEAFAQSPDCSSLISQTEVQRNIPRGLLMAIATTESGTNGRPNPTAMNIAGRSYFASSGQEMASIIAANWQRGVTSIDVGCMQINLKYHGSRFARLTDLLDSSTNVRYGASYLVSLAIQTGSWRDAVMSYHNRNNPARRAWYGCKVWNNYLRINGSQSGYLQCGGAPAGSSTASRATMVGYRPQNAWNPTSAPPSGPIRAAEYGQAEIGGRMVDVPVPARRVTGSIALVRDGQAIPDIVNDDDRQGAFRAVRPNDWSGRVRRAGDAGTVATSRETADGFGRVPK